MMYYGSCNSMDPINRFNRYIHLIIVIIYCMSYNVARVSIDPHVHSIQRDCNLKIELYVIDVHIVL